LIAASDAFRVCAGSTQGAKGASFLVAAVCSSLLIVLPLCSPMHRLCCPEGVCFAARPPWCSPPPRSLLRFTPRWPERIQPHTAPLQTQRSSAATQIKTNTIIIMHARYLTNSTNGSAIQVDACIGVGGAPDARSVDQQCRQPQEKALRQLSGCRACARPLHCPVLIPPPSTHTHTHTHVPE